MYLNIATRSLALVPKRRLIIIMQRMAKEEEEPEEEELQRWKEKRRDPGQFAD